MQQLFVDENKSITHAYPSRLSPRLPTGHVAREPNDRLARYLTFLPSQST